MFFAIGFLELAAQDGVEHHGEVYGGKSHGLKKGLKYQYYILCCLETCLEQSV